MSKHFEEKVVVVLDVIDDIKWVVERYRKKGWELASSTRTKGPPASVRITLRRKLRKS